MTVLLLQAIETADKCVNVQLLFCYMKVSRETGLDGVVPCIEDLVLVLRQKFTDKCSYVQNKKKGQLIKTDFTSYVYSFHKHLSTDKTGAASVTNNAAHSCHISV